VRLSVGTSGYSYKAWKGPFYPEKLPARAMLEHYASRLPSVEINNTFYRMPREEVVAGWADAVPATFRFAVKASRRITHLKRLADVQEPLDYMIRATGRLGERLGVTLFQLPPYMKKDRARLADFLALIPQGARAAMEFRHDSWFDHEIYDVLHERGVALCASDTDAGEHAGPLATASFGYLRLRRPDYDDRALETWVSRVLAQDWEEAFVYFKHEDEAAGPKMALRFLEIARGKGPS